jgi:hypothetical protein
MAQSTATSVPRGAKRSSGFRPKPHAGGRNESEEPPGKDHVPPPLRLAPRHPGPARLRSTLCQVVPKAREQDQS